MTQLLGLGDGPDPDFGVDGAGRARALGTVEREKRRRHPFEVASAIVERYAHDGGLEALLAEPGEVERLKWVGLYPQRQGGDAFMLRVKVPGGLLTADQVALLGELCGSYCDAPPDHVSGFPGPFADLTTRQAVQLHWLPLSAVPVIWERFARVGLTSVQACGDCARNVTCCPVSGVDRDEVVDALPVARAISAFFTGNRAYANLPRKFKIAVTGCVEDCARVEINDIGLWPAAHDDGTVGFNVLVGGGLSDGERMASDLDLFVRPDQAVELCRAVAQTYAELGDRERRGLARLRYLVEQLGPEGFRRELLERFDATPRLAGRTLTTAARADHVGVRPERRAGHVSVGLSVPVGRIGAEDLVELARLARRYGDGTVRTTVDQSVVLTGVAEQGLDALLDEPLLATCSPTPGPFVRGIATCTGSEFCRYAVVETKARAAALGRHLDEALGAELAVAGLSDRPLRIHVSGCSASCAQPQIADVGLRGAVAKSGDALVEAFDVGLGGRLGPDASFIDWVEGAVPAARLEDVLVDVARAFVHDRRGNESFTSFVRRHSRDELRALVGGGTVKGYAIREEMNGVDEPAGKTWFWELEAAVVDADRCVQCGTCVAVCPSNSIGVNLFTNLPELVKMCTGCSLCWDFCPRAGLRYEATWHPEGTGDDAPAPVSVGAAPRGDAPDEAVPQAPAADLGAVRERVSVRARTRATGAQDGGAVTAILSALLEGGTIDAAVVAAPPEGGGEDRRARAVVATTPAQLAAAAGSAYHQTMALAALDLPAGLPSAPRVAHVGTPCEVQGLRAMRLAPWPTGAHRVESVVLTIALLCTKSFDYERLYHEELRDRRGVPLRSLRRVDVTKGRLVVEDDLGVVVDEPVGAFRAAALRGCDECADFLGRAADLSIGSIGSAPGWSTVLARTEAGLDALRRSRHLLDVRAAVDLAPLVALDASNRRRAVASLARPLDEDGALFIPVEDHLVAYGGSDRAPVVSRR